MAKSFIDNDLYDVMLTLKHVRLRSIIKEALVQGEDLIEKEVAEYRSVSSISLLRKLQQKCSLQGTVKEKLDILSLTDLQYLNYKCSAQTGPLGYDSEGLNRFMLTNLVKGENDGTVAGNIGRDIFCGVFNDDSDDWNPMRKINGYTARVLLCGKDLIVVEPIRRTLTVVRNDQEWAEDVSPSMQMLQADARTPRIRLAAELLLCAVTGANKGTFNFLKDRYSENKISYEPREFKDVYVRGNTNGARMSANELKKLLENCCEDPVEAAVFRETLELFSRYSSGLEVFGNNSYKKVLYEQGCRGSRDKLNLDTPVPLVCILALPPDRFPGEGYLFADEVVFDCSWRMLHSDGKASAVIITGPRMLKKRKGLALSWSVEVEDSEGGNCAGTNLNLFQECGARMEL